MITLTGVYLVKKPGCSITHGIYLIINNCGQTVFLVETYKKCFL